MPKKPERPIGPDDEVRFTALMRREDRSRFKAWCEVRGLEMERVGAQWILERLASETGTGTKSARK